MENKDKNIEVKMSVPVMTNLEMAELDNNIEKYYSNIIDKISDHIYRDRELITLQRIIKYQDEKIKKLEGKNVKDKKRC